MGSKMQKTRDLRLSLGVQFFLGRLMLMKIVCRQKFLPLFSQTTFIARGQPVSSPLFLSL